MPEDNPTRVGTQGRKDYSGMTPVAVLNADGQLVNFPLISTSGTMPVNVASGSITIDTSVAPVNVSGTVSTNSLNDYWSDLSFGNVAGYGKVNKFGEASDIDTADGWLDIWDGVSVGIKTAYPYSADGVADIDSLVSSNNGDTEPITVQGLTSSGTQITQTVAISGQSRVALDTNMWRVFRMYNDNGTDLAGNVYCYASGVTVGTTNGIPDDLTVVKAVIQSDNNQTLMSLYTIPAGKTAGLKRQWASAVGKVNGYMGTRFYARASGSVFALKHSEGIGAGTRMDDLYEVMPTYPAMTDLVMRGDSSANDMIMSAGFDLVLKDD